MSPGARRAASCYAKRKPVGRYAAWRYAALDHTRENRINRLREVEAELRQGGRRVLHSLRWVRSMGASGYALALEEVLIQTAILVLVLT